MRRAETMERKTSKINFMIYFHAQPSSRPSNTISARSERALASQNAQNKLIHCVCCLRAVVCLSAGLSLHTAAADDDGIVLPVRAGCADKAQSGQLPLGEWGRGLDLGTITDKEKWA